jgi:integrase
LSWPNGSRVGYAPADSDYFGEVVVRISPPVDAGTSRCLDWRAAAPLGEVPRCADEPYLDEKTWDRIWTAAVKESGIPFKPTAYQVRHTHASWLIDADESPKAVMHRLT